MSFVASDIKFSIEIKREESLSQLASVFCGWWNAQTVVYEMECQQHVRCAIQYFFLLSDRTFKIISFFSAFVSSKVLILFFSSVFAASILSFRKEKSCIFNIRLFFCAIISFMFNILLVKNVLWNSSYLNGSFMWMYRSNEIAQRFKIEAVEHITSNATQVSQNWAPNTQ